MCTATILSSFSNFQEHVEKYEKFRYGNILFSLFKAVFALCPLFTVDSVFLEKPKPPGKISEEKFHIILHFYINPVFIPAYLTVFTLQTYILPMTDSRQLVL